MMQQQANSYDYQLGKVAGIWVAQQGLVLDAETLELEANEFYERAILFIVVERLSFVTGFKESYQGYRDGLM
jgi:hypothetical protein